VCAGAHPALHNLSPANFNKLYNGISASCVVKILSQAPNQMEKNSFIMHIQVYIYLYMYIRAGTIKNVYLGSPHCKILEHRRTKSALFRLDFAPTGRRCPLGAFQISNMTAWMTLLRAQGCSWRVTKGHKATIK